MNRVLVSAGGLRLELLPALGGSIGRFDWMEGDAAIPILRPILQDTPTSASTPASPLDGACFPLVPFCNRIRGGRFTFRSRDIRLTPLMQGDPSPLHGQGWQSPWQIGAHAADRATLLFSHDAGEWPWQYEARQSFVLDEGGLSVALVCVNTDREPMPCGLGFHPYFPCTPATHIRTQVDHVWAVDADILPVERLPATGRYAIDDAPVCGRGLDNGYGGWSGVTLIDAPNRPFRIRLRSPDARFFQLYSPVEGGLFVAEPVTHANAALNAPEERWGELGMTVLAPGQSATLRMRLDIAAT